MADVPQHPHLRALGREVERTGRRVGELDTLVRQLAADLAGLTRHLDGSLPEPGEEQVALGGTGSGVRAWLLADDPQQSLEDLADLVGWLDRVYLAYPDAHLPTCWLWHPAVVEELWWLRCAHADAYHSETGSWLRAGDWHDRQRPNVVRRVRAAVNTCELSEHRPGYPGARASLGAPLTSAAALIAEWVAAGRPAPAPEPTEPQLAEAEQVHRQEMDRSRSRR